MERGNSSSRPISLDLCKVRHLQLRSVSLSYFLPLLYACPVSTQFDGKYINDARMTNMFVPFTRSVVVLRIRVEACTLWKTRAVGGVLWSTEIGRAHRTARRVGLAHHVTALLSTISGNYNDCQPGSIFSTVPSSIVLAPQACCIFVTREFTIIQILMEYTEIYAPTDIGSIVLPLSSHSPSRSQAAESNDR
jgi:hypothetical protein